MVEFGYPNAVPMAVKVPITTTSINFPLMVRSMGLNHWGVG